MILLVLVVLPDPRLDTKLSLGPTNVHADKIFEKLLDARDWTARYTPGSVVSIALLRGFSLRTLQ